MVAAEPADFVHVYSTQENYEKRQEIDFFGEISGVSLSPDDECLYIGIWDRTYASLLQYNRKHAYQYLDSFIWVPIPELNHMYETWNRSTHFRVFGFVFLKLWLFWIKNRPNILE